MKIESEGTCEVKCIHEDSVREVKSKMLSEETFQGIASNFKILGDPTRVKILHALSKDELCVCDLAAILGMKDSAICHQLRLLRERNMVKFQKKGKMAYYQLADEHVIQLIRMESEHARECR